MKRFLPNKTAFWVVIMLMTLYSAYFSVYSIQQHRTFRTHASDLGQVDQALWNTLQGRFLEDTKPDGRQANRLTDHVEPTFALASLSYIFYDGVEAILVFQSIVIALAALPPIFWIARKKLQREWLGIAFAAMYLLFPALQAANLAEVHAVTLAPAPLMFAYYYGDERAWKRYALFSILALFVKEEIALMVGAMAIYFSVKAKYEKLQALSIALAVSSLLALAWFFFAGFVIIPQNNLAGLSPYVSRYPGASSSPLKLLGAIPALVSSVLIPEKLTYLAQLFASVGFLAILDPVSLLIGSPSLVLNLLSSYPAQYSGTYHYSAPIAPYFVLAAIGGTKKILDAKSWVSDAKRPILAGAFLVALGYHLTAGYTPIAGAFFFPESSPHEQLLARFASQVPRDARVSTTGSLFPHISHREFLYRFPVIKDAEYIFLDVAQESTTNPIDFRKNYLAALKQGFGVRDAADGYILLQRGVATQDLPDAFYSFLRTNAIPQNSVPVDFGDKIRFLGYDVRQDDWQRVYLRTYWTRLPSMEENNYALFPFFPDDSGAPRADAQLPPLLIHFWYPTARWRVGETIIADMLPIEIGTGQKIGVGVFFGAAWDSAEERLTPRSAAPVSIRGTWAMVGEIAKQGKKYSSQPVAP
jgi:uncharacterized membrane protein